MNRKEHDALGKNHLVYRTWDGHVEIHNPTPDRIQPGMMVSLWAGPRSSKEDLGATLIREVQEDRILVGHSIGGTKERWTWHPIELVKVVWDIGGYSRAMHLLDQFNTTMKNFIG